MADPQNEATDPQSSRPDYIVATALLAGITATAGALALFGVDNERVWGLLDEDTKQGYFIAAGISAVLGISGALISYLVMSRRRRFWLLLVGSIAYVSALIFGLLGAAYSADLKGRATIVSAKVGSHDGSNFLALQVEAAAIDQEERIGIIVTDLNTQRRIYRSFPEATAGTASTHVRIPTGGSRRLKIQAWVWKGQRDAAPGCVGLRSKALNRKSHCVWIELPRPILTSNSPARSPGRYPS